MISCLLITERNAKVDWVYLARCWQQGTAAASVKGDHELPCAGHSWFHTVPDGSRWFYNGATEATTESLSDAGGTFVK